MPAIHAIQVTTPNAAAPRPAHLSESSSRPISHRRELFVLVLALVTVPALLLPEALSDNGRIAMAVLAFGIIGWTLTRMDDVTIALVAAMVLVVTGAATPGQHYATLGHDLVWLLFGVFVIAAVLRARSVGEHVALVAMRRCRSVATRFHGMTFVIITTALVIPSTSSRGFLPGDATPPFARVGDIVTDVNIVTALDVSDSVGRHEQWIERDGLARAVVEPAFLEAIAAGRRARIGFAVFTWSSNGHTRMLMPWTLITSAEDAKRISRHLLSADLIDESRFSGGDEDQSDPARLDDRLTDISHAIDLGSGHLGSAPFATARSVMNVIGNGIDNVGVGPAQARNRALGRGFTINGLVMGPSDVIEHYQTEVVGGPGAFVIEVSDPEHVARAFVAKLRLDVAGLHGDRPIGPTGLFDGLKLRRPD